jgi:hypothetical protein
MDHEVRGWTTCDSAYKSESLCYCEWRPGKLPSIVSKHFQLLLIAEMLYFANIYTIKISLLFLYRRIFPLQWFRRVLLASGIFLTIMTLVSLLVCIIQCVPLHKMWEPTAPGHCIEFGKFALAMSCINVCTDIFMLALPLPVVWSLQINSHKKWLVSLSFAMGGS